MLTFRKAVEADVPLILTMIKELASYEGLLSEVTATEEILRKNLFERQMAEVVFPMLDGREIGFALFFHNFSTFLGRPGLYIEDLYIAPEYRGKGYGRALIEEVVRRYRDRYDVLQVGTGDSPLTIPFYERCGFVRSHVIKGFFTKNYDHEIVEGGVVLEDMVYLRRPI